MIYGDFLAHEYFLIIHNHKITEFKGLYDKKKTKTV